MAFVTHSKVIKVVWPVAQLLVCATLHTVVSGDVFHGGPTTTHARIQNQELSMNQIFF